MTYKLSVVSLLALSHAAAANAQDAPSGENLFRQCVTCHAVGEGARNRVGPVLNGIDGRKSAAVAGYAYSEAMKKADITWTGKNFGEFESGPSKRVPGTKMAIPGVKSETDASALWDYLKQFDEQGRKRPQAN